MKILVVAPQPFFSPRGTGFSVYHRTRVTCDLGHKVDLLTYGQGSDVDIPGCRIVRIPAFKWLGPVAVGPSKLKLFLDCIMILYTIGMLLRRRYDVVQPHEEAVFWCRWLKPIFRFRLVYDMHSSLPQQLSNFDFTKSRILYWLFDVLEKTSLKASDGVVVVCPALKDHALSLGAGDKVVLIENSLYDPIQLSESDLGHGQTTENADVHDLEATEQWIRAHAPDGVIAYAGTLEAYQGIDRLIEAFAVTARRVPGAGLLVLGGAPADAARYRTLADQLGLGESVLLTGQVPHAQAQRLVLSAGSAVSPRFAGTNTPMKIYELMALGIPIIATRIESHTQVLNDDIAILADVTEDALANAMVQLLSDRDSANALGRRAQQWYEENYSSERYVAKMRRLFALVS